MQRRQALGFFAASPVLAQAQNAVKKPPAPPAPPMSAASAAAIAELASDMDLMVETLATLHPGLLRYNAQIQIDTTMTSIKRSFGGAPDLAQRYLVLSRFLAMLKCGHSYANFFNQKREVQQALFDRRSRLPFAMRWIGEGMFVTSEQDLMPRGTQVGAINGIPVRTMLAALLPYARADGNNDAKRRNLLGLRGLSQYEFFDVFHGLVYGEPPGGVFKLDVKTPDGKISVVEAPALTAAERHAQLPQVADDAPVWSWRIDEAHGVAVLTMPGWALYNSQWDWQAWLTEKLDALAADDAAKGLVVDLRGNEGGLDCGNLILERFLRTDSALPLRRLVRYQKTPAHLNKVLDTWDESFRDWGDKAKRFDSRFFALPAGDATVRPKYGGTGARIDKPLVVLTDAANSSATFAFAQRVKTTRIGKLVGEATGGNQRGINGGAFFFVRLPASGLEFDLPLIGSFPLQPAPDAGIEPDVKVDVAAVDVATGIDTQMERALAVAKGS
jgi:Peptidase family S41